MTDAWRAAALATAAMALFTAETVLVKALEATPLATMVLVRSLGQLGWTAPALARRGLAVLRTDRPRLALFRGALSVSGWYGYYLSFAALPLATATVLSFTSVLFVTALAWPVLGERVDARRWAAALVGFGGVVVIARPGELPLALALPLAAGLLAALNGAAIMLTTKVLSRTERTETIMAWIGLVSVAVALPVALPGLAWPGWRDALLLGAAALAGPFAMHLWIEAVRRAEASALAPIAYTKLLFAGLAGALLFGEAPDLWLGLGAVLIVGSSAYITRAAARGERR